MPWIDRLSKAPPRFMLADIWRQVHHHQLAAKALNAELEAAAPAGRKREQTTIRVVELDLDQVVGAVDLPHSNDPALLEAGETIGGACALEQPALEVGVAARVAGD